MSLITDSDVLKPLPFDPLRLENFLTQLSKNLDISFAALRATIRSIESLLPDEISKEQLLKLTAESLASRVTEEPGFSDLAGRVEAYSIQQTVAHSFSKNFQLLRDNLHPATAEAHPLVSERANDFVQTHSEILDSWIDPSRDYTLTYFGIRTLANSYLISRGLTISETPQYLFMRVAVGIHGSDDHERALLAVKETYDLMSTKYFIHSSPTLFNAGTENNFLSLCFLMAVDDDSIDGIYRTLHKAALILKGSGGIGIHMHNIRSNGSLIKSSNGTSNGLVPMLRVFNSTARYVDQGGNKRPGAMAVYLEPWHGDIREVLELRKNHGQEELRARDLFYALWIPDLFMRRVKNNEDWSLFSPSDAKGLSDTYGEDFDKLYEQYEKKGIATATFKARKLWMQILESQTETGMPFMLYKDSCNRKLNQKNLGTIKSSNLCCEIVEYSSPDEIAVCNLGLLALASYVTADGDSAQFDFDKLHGVTKILARNLDNVIDVTSYPVIESQKSNMLHRPIAIGVQGLADTFLELRLPFDSEGARKLNRQIFETIYHGAVEASLEMAKERGAYSSFKGSPASLGQLQFDLWGHKPTFFEDWDELKEEIKIHGLRNSLLVAPMPTASTSQILGYNECFEPFTSNLYLRRVLSGEYQIVNKYLVKDLKELGLWNKAVKEKIIIDNGLIQNISVIPPELKELYKTVWEISQKTIVEMAAERGCFIDQLQSMNIHLKNPTMGSLTSCHFFAWEKGLKTGMYYLRTQAASRAIQFTVDEAALSEQISRLASPEGKSLRKRQYVESEKFRGRALGLPAKKRKAIEPLLPESIRRRSFAEDDAGEGPKIFDKTPIFCSIQAAENCDSCSG